MSRENVEIVRAWYEAYNRGDWDAMLKDAAPGFEVDFSRAIGPWRGVFGLEPDPDADQVIGYTSRAKTSGPRWTSGPR